LPWDNCATQLFECYLPIACVGTVHIIQNITPNEPIQNNFRDIKPTIVFGTELMWINMANDIKQIVNTNPTGIFNKLFVNKLILQEFGLDESKYNISYGYSSDTNLKSLFNDIGIEICNAFGTNETTGIISIAVPGCSKYYGFPIVDIKINRETSEIMVKGETIFKNYCKNSEKSDKMFFKKIWFKTGYTGYVDRDGSLCVTGTLIP